MVLAGPLAFAQPTYAQVSADCSGGPCVQVGLEDAPQSGLQFADDADHFVYCAEGATVTLEFLAQFNDGHSCGTCEHEPRTVTWAVDGATEFEITSASEYLVANKADATINLGEAGDIITVTCTVADSNTSGECYEDKGGDMDEHSGNHAGASASCTIKLWRLDLESDAEIQPDPDFPYYESEFAKSVTTTATVVGSVGTEFRWQSYIDGSLYKQLITTLNSWSGELVGQPTIIYSRAKVINQCDPSSGYAIRETSVSVNANIRRSGWTTEVQLAGSNDHWLSDDELAFPQVDWSLQIDGTLPTYGRLANARVPYDKNYVAAVVPIYSDLAEYPYDYWNFSSKIEDIESGPNEGLYYNVDSTMFEVRRQVLSNYWVHPSAGHPSTPSLDNYGTVYTNWLEVVEIAFGSDCKCLTPTIHTGTGTGAWYRANMWHEGRGSPGSPNKRLLGHHSRLEDFFAAQPRALVDPVYRCDLLYSDSEEGLRAQDEAQRFDASERLYAAIVALHDYLAGTTTRHNFLGDIWVFGPPPPIGWDNRSKMF